jgi:hypothetical protein
MSSFGDPSIPAQAAADRVGRQPQGRPLGSETGAPSRTSLSQMLVTPITNGAGVVQSPTKIVPCTRENRFVTLTAPFNNFAIYVNVDPNLNPRSSLALPPGLPYEITLAGNQDLWAVTDAPTFQTVRIQIAPAIASDTERRL